jgi:hippurate hydrolase
MCEPCHLCHDCAERALFGRYLPHLDRAFRGGYAVFLSWSFSPHVPQSNIVHIDPFFPGMASRHRILASTPHMTSDIKIDTDAFVSIRRRIHAEPELGFDVTATSELVASLLAGWGYDVHKGIGTSGVVGQLRLGNGEGRIGIRADMDALPIAEETGLPYASQSPGVMHACGHDGHTAMLLAAAEAIARRRNFNGTLNLIFQPAEESLDGARKMIADGLFDRFPCDAIFALHNAPGVPAGRFSVLEGPVSLSADSLDITINGQGGHGGLPQQTRDPIVAAAAIITGLQTVVSRNVAPEDTAVVSIGSIHGGAARNVIPSTVTLGLNIRARHPATRDLVERRVRELVTLTAQAHGVEAELNYRRLTPSLLNSPGPTALAHDACVEVVGQQNVDTQGEGMTASEDFAWMMNEVPGCYLFLGNGEGTVGGCAVHNPGYDFNDEVLPVGARAWVSLVERSLKS